VNDVNSICSLIGFKLGNSWETYVREQHKFPWTSLYLTSLELEKLGERTEPKQLEDCILYAIIYGTNGLQPINFRWHRSLWRSERWKSYEYSVVRKDEEPVNIDFTISEIQNKLFS